MLPELSNHSNFILFTLTLWENECQSRIKCTCYMGLHSQALMALSPTIFKACGQFLKILLYNPRPIRCFIQQNFETHSIFRWHMLSWIFWNKNKKTTTFKGNPENNSISLPYVLIKLFAVTVIIAACVLRWEGVLCNVGPGEMSGSGYWTDDMRSRGWRWRARSPQQAGGQIRWQVVMLRPSGCQKTSGAPTARCLCAIGC